MALARRPQVLPLSLQQIPGLKTLHATNDIRRTSFGSFLSQSSRQGDISRVLKSNTKTNPVIRSSFCDHRLIASWVTNEPLPACSIHFSDETFGDDATISYTEERRVSILLGS